jgi:serine/threonine protein kinase
MIHQDLRPENIMIDRTGTVKIIDFGATSIAGISDDQPLEILGTAQYSAPEYFIGDGGSSRSDIFSLGVITYQMLTGRLPYGAAVAKTRTKAQQRKLRYKSTLDDEREIPNWVDGALRKAVEPDPNRRYAELSEFVFDLRNPNASFDASPPALMERNPQLFWQCMTAALALAVLFLLAMR